MRFNRSVGIVWIALLVAFASVTLANSASPQLIVEVTTDKASYEAGETVAFEVRTFLDGQPADATIVRALIRLTLPGGRVVQSDVHKQFSRVGLGVYSASGVAQAPGTREVEVKAVLKQKVRACTCSHKSYRVQHIKSQGFANYDVQGEALLVGLASNVSSATTCDVLSVRVSLNHAAEIHLQLVYPSGARRDVVIPGWLSQGDHIVHFKPSKLDGGPAKITVIAVDRYGQRSHASVDVTLKRVSTCAC